MARNRARTRRGRATHSGTWDPLKAQETMLRLAALHPQETHAELAKRIFAENLLGAVQTQTDLSYNARSAKLRWKATKELLDGHWTVNGAIRIVVNDDGELEERW